MNGAACLKVIKELAFIIVNDGVIVEVSQPFMDMTELQVEDILNKNIKDLFNTLRVGPDVSYNNIDDRADYFLFTKSLEVKFVNIQVMCEGDGELYV